MKRILLFCVALLPCLAADAQIPKPGFLVSEIIHRQCGIADYRNERFDFARFPLRRDLAGLFAPGDTIRHNTYVLDIAIRDASDSIAGYRVQSPVQVGEPRDSVRNVYVHHPAFECTIKAALPADASDAAIARAVDSLHAVRTLPDDNRGILCAADQDDFSYAMQYLLSRHGICAEPIFTWQTTVPSVDSRAALLDRCCDRAATLRVGSDIERFVRRTRFDEACIYACQPSKEGGRAIFFFYVDGRFWCKRGFTEYVSYDTFESVWRHDKGMRRIVAYRLKPGFGSADQ